MSNGRQERLAPFRASQRRYRPGRREFERLVLAALAELPTEFRARLENVAIVVEEWPDSTPEQLPSGEPAELLGLYQGTPLWRRGGDYHLVPPDRITIFRGPILALCERRADVIQEIRDTLIHEIGHYFGLEEDELK